MQIFDTAKEIIDYIAVKYQKTQGKQLACFNVSDSLMLIGAYDDEFLIEGIVLYSDPTRDYKWVLLDNINADLSVRNYIEYIQELGEAIATFEVDRLFEDDLYDEDEEGFYEDLD